MSLFGHVMLHLHWKCLWNELCKLPIFSIQQLPLTLHTHTHARYLHLLLHIWFALTCLSRATCGSRTSPASPNTHTNTHTRAKISLHFLVGLVDICTLSTHLMQNTWITESREKGGGPSDSVLSALPPIYFPSFCTPSVCQDPLLALELSATPPQHSGIEDESCG